jgi:ribose transport system permease protein
MSVATAPAPSGRSPYLTAAGWRRMFRDRPIVPLLVLLAILVVLYEMVRPGQVSPGWAGVIVRTAIPLAILAGCQVITMLTGGIDLSVGSVASMSGFLVASLVSDYGLWPSVAVALLIATSAGLITGLGVGVFRVHPLIMTLGMGLVVFGFTNAWQLIRVQSGGGVPPEFRWIGSAPLTFAIGGGDISLLPPIPASLLLFVPLALIILFALRRTGYGRLLYAIGDNPIAVRLSGARSWQVLLVLYAISAFMAAVAGFLLSGGVNVASVTLADSYVLPSVAAAVIGGTSIMGGRGGYGGAIVGALILTVITALLSALGFPEAVRQVLFGAIIVAVAAAYTRVTGES